MSYGTPSKVCSRAVQSCVGVELEISSGNLHMNSYVFTYDFSYVNFVEFTYENSYVNLHMNSYVLYSGSRIPKKKGLVVLSFNW